MKIIVKTLIILFSLMAILLLSGCDIEKYLEEETKQTTATIDDYEDDKEDVDDWWEDDEAENTDYLDFIKDYNEVSKDHKITKKDVHAEDNGDGNITYKLKKCKFVLSTSDGKPYDYIKSGMKYSKKNKKRFFKEAKKVFKAYYCFGKKGTKKVLKKLSKGKYPYDNLTTFRGYDIEFENLDDDERFYISISR